jgi:hypothetical protein
MQLPLQRLHKEQVARQYKTILNILGATKNDSKSHLEKCL